MYAFSLWTLFTHTHADKAPPQKNKKNKKSNTYIQTQPHFTGLWHKMGFLCLSRGGPMATEGNTKRWELYNRWCQIGCQLQHKWLSITSVPHVKRPLYRRLDFRQHRKNLFPPAHSTALQEGSPHIYKEACIHAYMHKADIHNIHPYCCKYVAEKHLKNTHTLICIATHAHNSFFRKQITDEALGFL